MDVLRRQTPPPSSTLNPNAPVFIPMAYYDVIEDFSNEWWSLVQSSPWFRDYWLRECFEDPESDALFADADDPLLADLDSFFDEFLGKQEEAEGERKRSGMELITMNALGWKARGKGETPKYGEKAPKIVNVKVSPRPIQQPR